MPSIVCSSICKSSWPSLPALRWVVSSARGLCPVLRLLRSSECCQLGVIVAFRFTTVTKVRARTLKFSGQVGSGRQEKPCSLWTAGGNLPRPTQKKRKSGQGLLGSLRSITQQSRLRVSLCFPWGKPSESWDSKDGLMFAYFLLRERAVPQNMNMLASCRAWSRGHVSDQLVSDVCCAFLRSPPVL